jgi:hypothetical protein
VAHKSNEQGNGWRIGKWHQWSRNHLHLPTKIRKFFKTIYRRKRVKSVVGWKWIRRVFGWSTNHYISWLF